MKPATIYWVLFLVTISGTIGTLCAQTTRHVPGQYVTIQAALNAAQFGDTVLVQPGIYRENILWPSTNGIKMISAGDTSNTLIDGGMTSTVLYISSSGVVDSSTLVKGFKLRKGGNVANGGGIFLGNSSPRIQQCVVQECSGGGIYLLQSSPRIVDVVVQNNNGEGISCIQGSSPVLERVTVSGHTGYGNGIYCVTNANIILRDVLIENNNSGGRDGAGLACWNNSNALLERVTIGNNISNNNAGGIYSDGSTITIRNSVIMNNRGGFRGGGISGTNYIITDSYIIGNSGAYGGAIYAAAAGGTGITLDRCVISDNRSTWYGGALYFYNKFSPSITRTTFSRNSAKRGGAIYLEGNGIDYLVTPTITRSTFSDNFATEVGGGIFCNYATPNVSYSNFSGNSYGAYNVINATTPIFKSNWWGDMSGPYHNTRNPSGKGDSASIFIDVIPFLISPDTSTPPPTVRNVTILSTSSSTISIAWDSVMQADQAGYRIHYDTDSALFRFRNTIDVGNTTSYQIEGLLPGLKYYLTVTCYDRGGDESWVSKTVSSVTVNAPRITIATTSLIFDTTESGRISSRPLTIENTGTADLDISNISSSNAAFRVDTTALRITPNSKKMVTVSFAPPASGHYIGLLTIQNNSVNKSSFNVALSGIAVPPAAPKLLSVQDVPEDQGGFVRVKFQRSRYDGLDSTWKIVSYSVWRKFDESSWDALGMFNAIQDSIYYFVASTLCDSSPAGICWTTLKISAHTSDPSVFFFSDSAQGYSVDNIAPHIPQGLNISVTGSNIITLKWNNVPDKDFEYYVVSRDTIPDFQLGPTNFLSTVVDTVFSDTTATRFRQYFYKVIAVDHAGNRSLPSAEVSIILSAIKTTPPIPITYFLARNFPNPFNPTTTISFELPERSFVSLKLFDALGREISTLVSEELPPGKYAKQWKPIDQPSGVYFYRLQAGSFIGTKKLVLLR